MITKRYYIVLTYLQQLPIPVSNITKLDRKMRGSVYKHIDFTSLVSVSVLEKLKTIYRSHPVLPRLHVHISAFVHTETLDI